MVGEDVKPLFVMAEVCCCGIKDTADELLDAGDDGSVRVSDAVVPNEGAHAMLDEVAHSVVELHAVVDSGTGGRSVTDVGLADKDSTLVGASDAICAAFGSETLKYPTRKLRWVEESAS